MYNVKQEPDDIGKSQGYTQQCVCTYTAPMPVNKRILVNAKIIVTN